MKKSYKYGVLFLALAGIVLLGFGQAFATSTVLFDRGLPTANLNDAAGASRSNVNWADGEPTATSSPYWLPGDDFTIGTGGSYHIDTIRVWATTNNDATTNFNLFGGQAGSAISLWSSAYTTTPVTYSNGAGYQGSSGAFRQINQIDFTVNMDVSGGAKYQFFLDSPWSATGSGNPDAAYSNAYLLASNKDRSGHAMPGADNLFLYLTMTGTYPGGVTGSVLSYNMGGYGLVSDANVQVYGTPLPASILLLGSGLAGLAFWRRRQAAARNSG